MTDAFIAIVSSGSVVTGYKVSPQIIEDDGQAHPQILVGTSDGITPNPGDYVLVITTRNPLDNLPVQRYYEASEACGRIVAIIKTLTQYQLTGKYKFLGDVSILGKFDVNGNSTLNGNLTMTGNLTVTGNVDLTGDVTITGTCIINGIDFSTHVHANNAPAPGPTGPPV